MRVYCDLHIHSCLSPCAEDDMTPWNLVGMAKVKGLDVIALTDHNCARNVPAAIAAGRAYGVEVIPGMEVTAKEEVHILAYFPAAEAALAFGEEIYARLPDIRNRTDLFGNQMVTDEKDEPVGQAEKLLLNATALSMEEIGVLTERYGGVNVPAHINRGANSLIVALGMMPPLPAYPVVEVVPGLPCPKEATAGRTVLYSSDAHRLGDILERTFALDLPEPTAAATLAFLHAKINERP